MTEPCPWCGRLYSTRTHWVPGKTGQAVRLHDIEDHECPSFRTESPLLPIDPDFRVVPDRTDAEMAEAMRRYRRAIK